MYERNMLLDNNNVEEYNKLSLNRSFYNRHTIHVAIDLVGKILSYKSGLGTIKGKVVEVEAYLGEKDPACHAYVVKTKRSQIFWADPGLAYIFINYGIHHCLNAITEKPNVPGCVLIRAVEPLMGIDIMKRNRAKEELTLLTNGPGKLTQAFGINIIHNGMDLTDGDLTFETNDDCDDIVVSSRIGISKAKREPLRFYEKDNPFVSQIKRNKKVFFEGSPRKIKASFTDGVIQVNL